MPFKPFRDGKRTKIFYDRGRFEDNQDVKRLVPAPFELIDYRATSTAAHQEYISTVGSDCNFDPQVGDIDPEFGYVADLQIDFEAMGQEYVREQEHYYPTIYGWGIQ